MRRIRVIPVLLLRGNGLVKSVRFRDHRYIGDAINAVKVFNDKEVDELCLLDIDATREGRAPRFSYIREIVSEAFMPVAYGGGVRSAAHAEQLFAAGIEKVVLNSAVSSPGLVEQLAGRFGSQSVVASVDAKKGLLGRHRCYEHGGTRGVRQTPTERAREAVRAGAGEVFLTSMDRDGTFSGYDLDLTRAVVDAVDVPVIACGGAGSVAHMVAAVRDAGASAVAAGSFFVFIGQRRGVLINFPAQAQLRPLFELA